MIEKYYVNKYLLRLILSIINVFISFFTIWFILFLFGASKETDGLFLVVGIIEFLKSIFIANVKNVLTPKFVEIFKLNSYDKIYLEILNKFIKISFFITIVFFTIAKLVLPIYFIHIENNILNKLWIIFYILLLSFTIGFINSVLYSKINAKQCYIKGDSILIFVNIISFIIIYCFSKEFDIIAVALAFTSKEIIAFIILFPFKKYFTYLIISNRIDISKEINDIKKKILPLLYSTSYYKTEVLIDRFLLSSLKAGQLSLYLFSYQLISGVMVVLQRVIKVPILTYFSNKDITLKEFNSIFYKALFVCILLFLIFIFFGELILEYMPKFGVLKENNIYQIWLNSTMLFGVFIGGVIAYITTSIYHAFGATKLLAKISIINFTVMMPIKIMSFFYFGIVGLALSTSIYFLSAIVIQKIYIQKEILI